MKQKKTVFLFVYATKIYQLKAKTSIIKPHPLCIENISKYFRANNMRESGLNGYVYDFYIIFYYL